MPHGSSKKSAKSLPLQLMEEVNGSYRKTVLLQKRVRELVRGQRPLFETRETNPIAIALEEMRRGLIELSEPKEETF